MGPTPYTIVVRSAAGPQFYGTLESVRGIAALGVALLHVSFTNPTYDWHVVRNSYLFVDLFFVLSGFVMSHAYGERVRSGSQVGEYLWLRLGRIYPLHCVTLAILVGFELARFVVEQVMHDPTPMAFAHDGAGDLLANLLLVHAWGVTDGLTFNAPSWSIGAEFWAYVAFALAGLAGVRGRGWLAIGLVASAVGYGSLVAVHPESLDLTWDGGQLRCVAGFFFGIVVHRAVVGLEPIVRDRQAIVNAAAAAGFAALALVLAESRAGSLDYWFPLASAWTVGAVALATAGPLATVLASPPLRWLGRVSFSIYLWQFVLLRILTDVGLRLYDPPMAGEVIVLSPAMGAILVVAYLALLLSAAEVSFRVIEDPARRAARAKAETWFAQPARSQLRSQRSQ